MKSTGPYAEAMKRLAVPPTYPCFEHMRTEHPELYPVLRSLRSYWTDYLDWPTRWGLFDRVKHKYGSLEEVEASLDLIDGAFRLRWDVNCGDHLDSKRDACGTPIYRFNVKNPHGPAGVRYGLTPFRGLDVMKRELVRPVLRGAVDPREITDGEYAIWQELADNPETTLEIGAVLQPDAHLWACSTLLGDDID